MFALPFLLDFVPDFPIFFIFLLFRIVITFLHSSGVSGHDLSEKCSHGAIQYYLDKYSIIKMDNRQQFPCLRTPERPSVFRFLSR
ncbi:UNVERIFIED_CONTAM: hypothetical protein FKN15_031062 [Acipenser sinensis]